MHLARIHWKSQQSSCLAKVKGSTVRVTEMRRILTQLTSLNSATKKKYLVTQDLREVLSIKRKIIIIIKKKIGQGSCLLV